jgi:alkylation response protein AidB-like acyl-CoA dehydrogenase
VPNPYVHGPALPAGPGGVVAPALLGGLAQELTGVEVEDATAAGPGAGVEETDLDSLRARTRALCSQFPDDYWRETDLSRRYPQEFVDTLTAAGLLAALIPTDYCGLGASLTQASVIMEEINKSGGHSAACHAQMYTMGALLRHGSDQLKTTYLPLMAKGGAAPAGVLHHRTRRRLRHHQHHHHR